MTAILELKNLHASVEDTPILKGVNLTINPGEVHAIMGPNGSGKSTLSKVLVGYPGYDITDGTAFMNGQDIAEMDPQERAHLGLFLAFQYPVEIPGVKNGDFLRMAYNAKLKSQGKPEIEPFEFHAMVAEKCRLADINPGFLDRDVNHGFSGGEKKRNEILQMLVLEPTLAILDETDSGLDIDALKKVAHAVNAYRNKDNGFLIITHYQRLLNYIEPDVVHIFDDGKIVKTGSKELALELEEKGYQAV